MDKNSNNIHKIQTITLDDKVYNLGFKVVTQNLESLGLRKNPNIIKYPISEWYFLSQNQIVDGQDDFGGIWVARTLSGAKNLQKYMQKQYSKETRIFKTAIDKILYSNSYRVKTNGINMLEEIV
ncbi:MAG: hypothetical protein ACP5N1_07260 [Candidatus Woesearchaeota archaeon]